KTADSMKRSVQQSIDIEKAEDEANTIHAPQQRAAESVTPATAHTQASAPAQAPEAAAEAVETAKTDANPQAAVVNPAPAAPRSPATTSSASDER
ncbi:hypothetical protein ABH309_25020, partial [Chromobacterium piscinae]